MTHEDEGTQLVIVGASAGGIDALSTFVANLPVNFPAPIVVAQHLDPQRPSHLEQILERRSTIPVKTVLDHESLEPGVLYLVPANRNVEITDHALRVVEGEGKPKPSIDLLMRTSASIFGEGLIAIILTGTGSDGAAGAFDVKRVGGTVIIQNPATAAFPALPLSLSPTTVDITAEVADMGRLLVDLLTGIYEAPEDTDEQSLEGILRQLEQRHGINFSNYKLPTIMRRLKRRMTATGQASISDYYRYLQGHPEEYQHLIDSFLIKVTQFFRDPETFEYLQTRIIPTLVQESRARDNEIRIWSAGCATGEEAFSLAILVAEALGDEINRFHVRIFATDLDAAAVEFARRGIYPSTSLEDVPDAIIERYFTEIPEGYSVRKNIRSLTVFGQHDLAERAPFPRIDLLVCRNVLIYFTPELQRHVLQLMAFSLRDGGYLALGKAETTSPVPDFFVAESPALKVYRRRGDRALVVPSRLTDTMRPSSSTAMTHRTVGPDAIPNRPRDSKRMPTARERADIMLLHLPLGVVVVNRRYDIQSINTSARMILGIHGAAIGEDFVHLAQSFPSQELLSAIDGAFNGGEPRELPEVAVPGSSDGEQRYLHVTCHPTPPELAGAEATVMITIEDISRQVQQRKQLQDDVERRATDNARLREQVERLTSSNAELLAANEEVSTIAMELRSANEEFLVGNEELQAATEEVETLNEELQATNEELETLNEELQATVEELNTTNDDLQARSIELQELAVSLETERRSSELERARLSAILASMADAVLVVDSEGRVVQTNAAYDRSFGNDGFSAIDEEGASLAEDSTPQAKAARGESFTMEFTVSLSDSSLRRYEASGQPIVDGEVGGGVVVLRDITARDTHTN